MNYSHPRFFALILIAAFGCLAALGIGWPLPATAQGSAQIQDGDFEQPYYYGITVFYAGDTFNDWHVTAGSVDLVADRYWQPEQGHQALDLSGDTAGTLYQDVSTIPNQTYCLSFYLSGNPYDQPDIKKMNVFADETQIGHFTFDTTNTSVTNMGWRLTQVTFSAKSGTTRITFQSLNESHNGPVIDNVSLAPGSASGTSDTHLLWTNTNGMASVWNLADANPAATCKLYGPYAGWMATAIAQGPDGYGRILWTNTDGRAALWNLADTNPSATCFLYGPYVGWTATALAVGPDNAAHLLWDNSDGRVALWNTTDANPTATCTIAGPYTGWSGVAIGIGPDNKERLLWDNVSGEAAIWNLSDPTPVVTCLLAGPYSGWTAKRLSVGPDNGAHLLWDNASGQVSLWNLSDPNPAATCTLAGPYAGWTALDLSVGADGKGRLLWDNLGQQSSHRVLRSVLGKKGRSPRDQGTGQVSLWNLANMNPAATCMLVGPYTGWTAVSIAAGR